MKLEFSRQTFKKYSDIRFYENPSSGSRGASCGQTDGLDEATNFANAPKKAFTYYQVVFRQHVVIEGCFFSRIASYLMF